MKFEDFRLNTSPRVGSGIGWLLASPVGPRIYLAPEDGTGSGGGDGGSNGDSKTGSDDAGKGDQGTGDGKAGEGGSDGGESGKRKPTDEEAKLLKDAMKHKDRANALKAELDERDTKLKQFEGLDPVKARAALKALEDAEREAAEKSGDFDRVKAMMADQHKKDLEARDARIQELEGLVNANSSTINELTIGNAFANSSFIQEKLVLSPTKTRQIYGGHFDIEDGKLVAYDKPAGAKDRTKFVDGAGEVMSFEAALSKLVEGDPDRERIVRSTQKPGAGSTTTNDSKTPDSQKGNTLFGVSRMAAALAARKASSK